MTITTDMGLKTGDHICTADSRWYTIVDGGGSQAFKAKIHGGIAVRYIPHGDVVQCARQNPDACPPGPQCGTPAAAPAPVYTGGSASYYSLEIKNPMKGDPITVECNDVIEALGMNFAEGNAFKALWRRAAARMGKLKRGYDGGLYDAEKVEFFGARLVAQSKATP